MSTTANWFQKVYLIGVVVAFALVVQPAGSAFALSPAYTVTPPPPHPRLELTQQLEQMVYNRLGNLIDRVDERIAKGQELIDKVKANGKEVTAVQAALNTFSDAVKQARPVYDSGNAIISS